MTKITIKNKILLLFIVGLLFTQLTFAQTKTKKNSSPPPPPSPSPFSPSLILNWQTNNFVPSTYEGKILPTNGSTIYLSLIAKNNDTVIDLSNSLILWYLDGDFYDGGVGQTNMQFKVTKVANNFHFVSVNVSVSQPDGSSQVLTQSVNIPIINPQVVINVPYTNIPSNSSVSLSAIPYFFNIQSLDDLSFNWKITTPLETQNASGDNTITINTNDYLKGKQINVALQTQNNKNPFEFAKNQTTLYVQ